MDEIINGIIEAVAGKTEEEVIAEIAASAHAGSIADHAQLAKYFIQLAESASGLTAQAEEGAAV